MNHPRRSVTKRATTTVAGVTAAVVVAMASGRIGPTAAPPGLQAGAAPPPSAPAAAGPSWQSLLGADIRARIPADTAQLVLVSGVGEDSSNSSLTVWDRTGDDGWQPLVTWPAHNGLNGWSSHHLRGDLRSPAGVYTLTDAGGRRRDPGTRLPYHWDEDFTADGTGFEGEPLAGSFDYVIAIDYNRVPGSSPLDTRRPLGNSRGGGIWLHVDHGGPTHGCVTLTEDHMIELLRLLDPAAHPVIVMGPSV